ncbi:glycosyltransferase family 2 protein [Pseudolysinimonas sp.]|jgi:glycosyltransferase involved in cell wall biosynthesis|uniref:glycosyltransferase family 2 protein n=1 Tax=Pseudolysinimonas sp. TaxID=2680009 RepID=UPI003783B5CA
MHDSRTAVSIIIPAYNESASIIASIDRIVSVVEGTRRPFEVIVVSDGSTDDTAAKVRAVAHPAVRLIDNSKNRGKGFALRTGFLEAAHPLIAFIDGDLDLDPVVLPDYFDLLDEGEADVVIGSKMHPESVVDYPLKRRLASRAFRLATRVVTGLNLSDTQTGLKAMTREIALPAVRRCVSNGFSFDLELLAQMSDDGARIREAPVVLTYEFTSSVGLRNITTALGELRHASRGRRRAMRRGEGGTA